MKTLVYLLSFLCSFALCAQDYYWVGGTGNWSDYANHWATSSGGSSFHTQAPTSTDNVFFDANSFSSTSQVVTLDANGSCNNIDWTGVTNSPEFVANSGIDLNLNGSLTFDENATYDLREIFFHSTDSDETINAAGLDLGQYCDFTFEGAGEWTFENDAYARNIKLNDGTINFGSYFINASSELNIRGSSGTTTLNLESATLEIGELETRFASSYVINPGTSTIRLQGCCFSQNFYGDDQTYYNLEIPVGTNTIEGSNEFNKITISAGVTAKFEAGSTQTFSELDAVGTSSDVITITSDSEGSQATLALKSGGTDVEAYYLEIQDIVATGDNAFEAFQSTDNGNNSGWNITAPVPDEYYWVGGSGSWSDLNHWATESGGNTFYGELPTKEDNVNFDENSFTADDQSVTLDVDGSCHDFDWTGITYDVSIEEGTENEIEIHGSVALSNLVRIGNDVDLTMLSGEAETFSMGDDPEVRKDIDANRTVISFEGDGSWTVQDHITSEGSVWVEGNATLNLDGNPLWAQQISLGASATLSSGDNAVITFEDWFCSSSSLTFGTGTELILQQFNQFDGFGNFTGNDNTYLTLSIENADQTIRLDDSNTFETLSIVEGATIEFEGSETQTVTNLTADGTKFNGITFYSDNAGEQAIISKSSGTVDVSYVSLKDMQATGGATFNAESSTDNGNNSGWNITAPTSQDYYWVGDGGSWDDLTHWVTTSGGSTQHTSLPGSIDRIIFDANSFSSDDQEVAISEEVTVDDVDFSAVSNEPTLSSSADFYVNGSFVLGTGVTIEAAVYLESEGSETIESNGSTGIETLFLTSAGSYTLTGPFHFDGLTIENGGTMVVDNQELEVGNLLLDGSVTLSAQNATITAASYQSNNTTTQTMDGSTLNIEEVTRLNGSVVSSLAFTPAFNNSNTPAFASVNFNGVIDLTYKNEFSIDSWSIEAGSEVVFDDFGSSATTISIGDLTADGTNADHIIFQSANSGTQFVIESTSGTTVDVSWVELTDSQVSGTTFNAENSFDNGNNSGWTITAPPDVPDAPENLVTFNISASGFTASWDAVTDADEYYIDIARDAGFTTLSEEDVLVDDGTSYEVTSLFDAEEYYWRVRASNDGGISSNSATAETVTLPETPVALDAESIFSNKFTAKWDEVDGAESYRLDVSESSDFSSYLSGFEDLEVSSTSQQVDGLSENVEYYYRVRAVNTSGATPNSNVVSVNTSTKQDQTIAFDLGDDAIKEVTDADFTISASASSGLDVYFESSNEDVATVTGNLVSIVGAGSTTITAYQDGDENYNEAGPVEQSLDVGKTAQTITFDPDPIPDQNLSSGTLDIEITVDSGLPLIVSITNGDAEIEESATAGVYTITFGSAGNVTVEAEQAGDDDYANATESISFTIMDDVLDDQEITFSLGDDAIKTFGDAVFTLSGSASSGLTVDYESSDESVAMVSGNQVTIVGAGTTIITASQDGDEDYNPASSVEQTLTVNKADQTITFDELVEKTYGDDPFDVSATASSGLTVDFEVVNTFIASVDGSTITIEGAGTTSVRAIQEGDDNYNAAPSVERSLVINKANQTITFEPWEIEDLLIDADDFALQITNSSGLDLNVISNEVIEVIETDDNEYLVSIVSDGEATITASHDGTSNYEETSAIIDFSVSKYTQVITFDGLTEKTFGDQPFDLTAETSSDLEVDYSSSNLEVATVSNNTVTIVGAGSAIITAFQDGNELYSSAASVEQSLTVHKATQTITFDEFPDAEVDQTIQLEASASSELEVSFDVSGPVEFDGATLTTTGAGTVTIVASQAGDNNYHPAENVTRSFEVTARSSQTISFEAIEEKTYGDPVFSLSATSSSGLGISYVSSDESVATISGNEVTIVGAGSTMITASQAGDDDFLPAEDVSQTLLVNKAEQIISFPALDNMSVGEVITLSASATSGLDISFSVDGPAELNGDQLAALSLGTVTVNASQVGNSNYHSADEVIRSFEIIEQVLGIEEMDITIYPNPFTKMLFINSPNSVDLSIYDLEGKLVRYHSKVMNAIDLSELSDGTYLILIELEDQLQRMILIKE